MIVADLLRIYVLFHPQSAAAGSYAEAVSRHFDGLGMERKLLIMLGAFGGATRDVAIALELLPKEARVPRGPQMESYLPALGQLERFRDRSAHSELAELAGMDRTETLARARPHWPENPG